MPAVDAGPPPADAGPTPGDAGPSVTYCSGLSVLTDPTGTITDGSGTGNYRSNTSCSWRVTVAGATAIELDFTQFLLETCCDFVTVYAGTSASGTQLGRFNAMDIPPRLIVPGSSMFVTFTTDLTGNYGGFTANYTARTVPLESCTNGSDDDSDGLVDCADTRDCGTSEACTPVRCGGTVDRSAARGTLQDGSGPSANYANNADCGWRITRPGASSMQLDFREFDTESSFDFVRVYEGTSTSGRLVGTYSGNTLPPRVFVTGPSMFVRFTSDASGTRAGWLAEYTARTAALEQCGNGTDDDGDSLVDCVDDDCGADEACSPVLCSGTVTRSAMSGFLQDGSGPSANYANSASCGWQITVPGAQSISLDARELALENNFDFVTVYEGVGAGGRQLARWTGSTLPPRVLATGPSMFVRFTSDASGSAAGFRLEYLARSTPVEICTNGTDEDGDAQIDCADADCAGSEACTPIPCGGTVDRTARTGVIQDGSGPSANYANSANCAWRVDVPGATSLTLTFSQFATEQGFDFVTVYRGTGTSGTQVARISGNMSPAPVVVTGSQMYVTFTSDSGTTAAGFTASYAAMP